MIETICVCIYKRTYLSSFTFLADLFQNLDPFTPSYWCWRIASFVKLLIYLISDTLFGKLTFGMICFTLASRLGSILTCVEIEESGILGWNFIFSSKNQEDTNGSYTEQ